MWGGEAHVGRDCARTGVVRRLGLQELAGDGVVQGLGNALRENWRLCGKWSCAITEVVRRVVQGLERCEDWVIRGIDYIKCCIDKYLVIFVK
jgi:hypothetical protein